MKRQQLVWGFALSLVFISNITETFFMYLHMHTLFADI